MPAQSESGKNPHSIVATIAFVAWFILILAGTQMLISYSNNRVDRPRNASLNHASLANLVGRDGHSLVLFVHPKCACSLATLRELSSVLRKVSTPFQLTVVMYCPLGKSLDWVEGKIERLARSLEPKEFLYDSGELFQQNGVLNSGHVFCFDDSGRIRFSGGVTVSRGHEGRNRASLALSRILEGAEGQSVEFPVFGCSIQDLKFAVED